MTAWLFIMGLLAVSATGERNAWALGIFEKSADIGRVSHAGSARYDANAQTYTITGGGANIWGTQDAFQYLWRELSGDAAMTADVSCLGQGHDPHRKAGWMVRQSPEPDSAYVDAVVLRDPVLAGLVVCSHDDSLTETAVFSNVDLKTMGKPKTEERVIESTLETISVRTGERRVVYRARKHFEAPNWSPDGSYLLFNGNGRLFTIPLEGGEPRQLDTGIAIKCNNDHGFSPDGRLLVFLSYDKSVQGHPANQDVSLRIMDLPGGAPRVLTRLFGGQGTINVPSWSPDSRQIAFVSYRLTAP